MATTTKTIALSRMAPGMVATRCTTHDGDVFGPVHVLTREVFSDGAVRVTFRCGNDTHAWLIFDEYDDAMARVIV